SAYWSASRRDRAVERMATERATSVKIQLLGPGPATFEGGRTAFMEVDRSGATAVVAFNDLQAAGVLVAAQLSGRSVPDSLSVVGSDGLALAAMTSPPLTSVAAPLDELGLTARRRLGDLLAERPAPLHTTLAPRLVVSATSGPPAPSRTTNHRLGRTD